MPACCEQTEIMLASGSFLSPEWLQVLSVVPLMALLHCGGMCGPLILSFRFGWHKDGNRARAFAAAGQLAAYQSGRSVLYMSFGAAAGAFGALIGSSLFTAQRYLVLAIALGFLALAAQKLGWVPGGGPGGPGLSGRLLAWLKRSGIQQPTLYAGLLGMVMAFLPCGLTLLVLGQAAAHGVWWEGALMMLFLVLVSTVPLLLFALAPAFLRRLRAGMSTRWEAALIAGSGIWIGLHGLAIWGLIPHAKWMLTWGDQRIPLMLW